VVYVWDGNGAPLDTLRWEATLQPLNDELIAGFVARETSDLKPAERENVRKEMQEGTRPATAPVFDLLRVGPNNELWVRRFDLPDSKSSEWLVFDAAGALQARVRIPRERQIRAVGRDRIYTLERDENDVEYVRGYQLRR
jgi:hypothetical protein